MINQDLKLNPNIFNSDVKKVPIRTGFGEGLVIAADNNEEVVGLCADLTDSVKMRDFADKYPKRFIQMGVAEQNMASVASGMAAMGKIPFMASYAMFSPGRNWEQIRTTICYNDVPVKIAGSHAGISVGPDGGTHQAIEDIALMRVMPNMVVISPCDAIEAKKATVAAAQTSYPTYIRLARNASPLITTEETPFEIGRAQVVYDGEGASDVAIIATGPPVYEALLAAKELEERGLKATVCNMATIKPLDTKMIDELVSSAGAIVTVEDHQKAGGLGSAVAEYVVSSKLVPIEMVGVNDQFGQSGKPEELMEYYGLGVADIVVAAEKVVGRKEI